MWAGQDSNFANLDTYSKNRSKLKIFSKKIKKSLEVILKGTTFVISK